MKASLIYNPASGHHRIKRRLSYIRKELEPIFDDLRILPSASDEDFIALIKKESASSDALLISGGDGSVHMAIQVLAKLDHAPILGILPLGTINDCAKTFLGTSSLKKALSIIKGQRHKKVDLFKLNDVYGAYVASCGAYSDIPLAVPNKAKAIFGRLAYYFAAIPRVFKKAGVKGTLVIDDERIDVDTPFLLIMNGDRMGGFRINKGRKIDDGLVDIVYGKKGLFHSLPQYFFANKTLKRYPIKKAAFLSEDACFHVDGEAGVQGNIDIEVCPKALEIFY